MGGFRTAAMPKPNSGGYHIYRGLGRFLGFVIFFSHRLLKYPYQLPPLNIFVDTKKLSEKVGNKSNSKH